MNLKNTILLSVSKLTKKQVRYGFALIMTIVVLISDSMNNSFVVHPMSDAKNQISEIQKKISDDEQLLIQLPMVQKKISSDTQHLNELLAENRRLENEIKSYAEKVSATSVFSAIDGLKSTNQAFKDAVIETERGVDASLKVKIVLDGKYSMIVEAVKAMENHEVLKHIYSVDYVVKEYPLSHVIIIINL